MNLEQQTLGAFAIANEDRKKSLLKYVSEGATPEDLDAAGYTSAEVAAAFSAPDLPTMNLSQEFNRDRQGGDTEYAAKQGTLEPYTPTYRQNLNEDVVGTFEALGIPEAQSKADVLTGNAATGQMGFADFTPLAIPMGTQEGARQVQAGLNTGSKTDVALGALNVGLSAAEAIPGGVLLTKMGKAAVKDAVEAGAKYLPDLAAKSMDAIDTAMYETFGRPAQTLIPVRAGATSATTRGAVRPEVNYNSNVTNMFGGESAQNFPHLLEAEAWMRTVKGEDTDQIWKDTGIQYLPDGRAVFQIDPAGATLKDFDGLKGEVPLLSAPKTPGGPLEKVDYPLADVYDFPELYDNYPILKNFKLVFDPQLRGGYFDASKKEVAISPNYLDNTPEDLKDILHHELQHGIQAVERTSGGAAPSYFLQRGLVLNPLTGKEERTGKFVTGALDMVNEVADLNKLEDAYNKLSAQYSKAINEPQAVQNALYQQVDAAYKILNTEYQRLNKLAYDKYFENPGEIEARAASIWARLTPEERLNTKPSDVYDQAYGYAKFNDPAKYGDNDMPTGRLPPKQEEMREQLDLGAKVFTPNASESNLDDLAIATSGKVSNPLLKAEDWSKDPSVEMNSDLNFIASFYSPLRSTIEQMPIAKDGSTGQTILAYLKKRAPNVSADELEFSGLKLDPNKRYTREDVNNLLRYSTSDTYANLAEVRPKKSALTSKISGTKGSMRFSQTQPQNVTDNQEAYFEITLDTGRLPKDLVPGVTTHHGETTLAHTRGSINSAPDGKYIFVWEFQSDPLQNIGKKYNPLENTGYGGPSAFDGLWVEEKLRDLVNFNDTIANPDTKLFKDTIKKLFEPDMDKEKLVKFYKDNYKIDVSGRSLEALARDAIRKTTDSIDEPFEDFMDEFFQDLGVKASDYKSAEAALEKSELPFSTNTQYVKNLLVSLAARAKKDNITKIVIPPIEEIARQREKDFEGGLQAAIKALRPTYVNAVRKAVNILNNETKGGIKVGTRNLQYKDLTQKSGVRNATGVELDISNFNFNPEKERVRFAEGGMVEDEQMNMMMKEGGIAGSSVTREPVTGNEVPPGALPSEVRDDVPAQLSEGEYIVPADVVRFFGVKYFEDLRMQAKQGLSEMQSNGRIGGTTVDANGVPMEEEEEGEEEELSPEEEQMLKEALGTSSEVSGMAVGGAVETPFDRTQFKLPTGASTTGRDSRKYIDPTTGITQTFQFLFGQPVTSIPSNFVPWTQELEDATKNKATQTITNPAIEAPQVSSGGGNSGGSGAPAPTGGSTGGGFNYDDWAKTNYKAITSDPYQFGLDALTDDSGKVGSKIAGGVGLATGNLPLAVVGMGIKAGNKIQNIAEAHAALKIMEAQGLSKSENYKNLQKVIGIAVDALPAPQQLLIEKELVATGKGYQTALNKIGGSVTSSKPGLAAPVNTPVKVESTPLPTTPPPSGSGGAYSTYKASPAEIQKSKDVSTGKTAAAGKSYASVGGYRSGRAKGGLVTKPAKNK